MIASRPYSRQGEKNFEVEVANENTPPAKRPFQCEVSPGESKSVPEIESIAFSDFKCLARVLVGLACVPTNGTDTQKVPQDLAPDFQLQLKSVGTYST